MGFKDFFFEEDKPTTKPFPSGKVNEVVQQQYVVNNTDFLTANQPITVAEDRHIQHVASILANTNAGRQDYIFFSKMVKKMSSGTVGSQLWVQAFAAFSAINDTATPEYLITSAEEYKKALTDDAANVTNLHNAKFTDPASEIGVLNALSNSLTSDIDILQKNLEGKQKQLQQSQVDIAAATNKAQASIASYTIASNDAVNEIVKFEDQIKNNLIQKA